MISRNWTINEFKCSNVLHSTYLYTSFIFVVDIIDSSVLQGLRYVCGIIHMCNECVMCSFNGIVFNFLRYKCVATDLFSYHQNINFYIVHHQNINIPLWCFLPDSSACEFSLASLVPNDWIWWYYLQFSMIIIKNLYRK